MMSTTRVALIAFALGAAPALAQITIPRDPEHGITPQTLSGVLAGLQAQISRKADAGALAPLARSGSASDITTGVLAVDRLAAGSIGGDKLAAGAIASALGYTPLGAAANLADIASAAAARANLGLASVAATGSAADLVGTLAHERLPATLGSIVAADATGASDASAAINALTMAGKTAVLPCGTYLLGATIRMADGSTLDGQGCATLVASPAMTANPIWGSIPGASATARMMISNKDAAGNSAITVKGLTFVGDGKPQPGHLVAFYKAEGVKFINNRCVATAAAPALDCVAFVQSADYTASGNYCRGMTNACIDQWDGAKDFIVEGNTVEGLGLIKYGVLINGLATANTANHTWRGVVRNNIVRGTIDVAIWAGGLCGGSPTQCGTVNEVAVEGNIVDGGGYQSGGAYLANIGVYVSDGVRNRVSGNVIRNVGGPAIRIATQASGGVTDQTIVTGNQIVAAALNPTTSAIRVEPGVGAATNTTLTDNAVDAGGHNYAVYISPGVTGTKLACGRMTAGAAGVIANSGTGTVMSCHDGASNQIVGPGSLKLGAGDAPGLWTLDASGNLYPASSGVRSLGFATNAIGLVTSKQLALVRQTIATLPTCDSAAAGYGMAISNGQTTAAAGYGASVGSTTGSTTRRILCDGAAWVYN